MTQDTPSDPYTFTFSGISRLRSNLIIKPVDGITNFRYFVEEYHSMRAREKIKSLILNIQ